MLFACRKFRICAVTRAFQTTTQTFLFSPFLARHLYHIVRSGLCAADTPNLTELIESSDDALCNRVLCNQDHILFPLLPDERDFTYNLRKRNHNSLLTIKQDRLCSCNFITIDCCSKPVIDFVVLHFILAIFLISIHVLLCDCCVLSTCIKRTCYAMLVISLD